MAQVILSKLMWLEERETQISAFYQCKPSILFADKGNVSVYNKTLSAGLFLGPEPFYSVQNLGAYFVHTCTYSICMKLCTH